MRLRFRLVLACLCAGVVVVGGGTATGAPTELFFSEYVEGTSFNKAVEIYNGTGAPVDLGALGYKLELYTNGSATASQTLNLTGSLANGDVFVAAHPTANALILAQADVTSSTVINWNGDDAVVLRKGSTIVDVIGQIGFDPGTEWGTGLTSTADNTIRRKTAVEAGDVNGADAFDPATEWDGYAVDTFDGLGAHSLGDSAPNVTATSPFSGATGVSVDANVSVTFSEPVNVTDPWATISCTSSGGHSSVSSGGPTTFTLNPTSDFVAGEVAPSRSSPAPSPTRTRTTRRTRWRATTSSRSRRSPRRRASSSRSTSRVRATTRPSRSTTAAVRRSTSVRRATGSSSTRTAPPPLQPGRST